MDQIEPLDNEQIAYTLRLTPAELKITHTALHALLDGFGHDERDVGAIVRGLLDKLPGEHDIRAIDLQTEIARQRARA